MLRIQRKICLVGATAVGKTSLVRRFVESLFSEKYHATIGVKIDRKVVTVGDTEMSLAIWDLQGADDAERVRESYLRGAAGVLIVADGTRPDTLTDAGAIHNDVSASLGDIPALLLLNKADLADAWALGDVGAGWPSVPVLRTSAKTGEGVESAFTHLVEQMSGV